MFIRAEKVYATAGLIALLVALIAWLAYIDFTKPADVKMTSSPTPPTTRRVLTHRQMPTPAQPRTAADKSLRDAIANGDHEAARRALALGANPNVTVENGDPLLIYTHPGHHAIILLLLAWNANPNATDRDGCTAAMRAITFSGFNMGGNLPTAQDAYELTADLLLAGGDPLQRDAEGHDLYDYVEGRAQTKIVRRLIDRDARIHREFLLLLQAYRIPGSRQGGKD